MPNKKNEGSYFERNVQKIRGFARSYGKKALIDDSYIDYATKYRKLDEKDLKAPLTGRIEGYNRYDGPVPEFQPPAQNIDPNQVFREKKAKEEHEELMIDWYDRHKKQHYESPSEPYHNDLLVHTEPEDEPVAASDFLTTTDDGWDIDDYSIFDEDIDPDIDNEE